VVWTSTDDSTVYCSLFTAYFSPLMPGLVIKPRSRILHGHDWLYATEVLKSFGEPKDGDVVSLKDGNDRLLGSAILIAVRRSSRVGSPASARIWIASFSSDG